MLNLMIVDDDCGVLESLCLGLNDAFNIVACSSVEKMETQLEKFRPDLILLDYRLGTSTGTMVLEKMRREGNCPPVVLLSALMTVALARQAMGLGAVDCIAKPVQLSKLKQRLKAALGVGGRENGSNRPYLSQVATLLRRYSAPLDDEALDSRRDHFMRDLLGETLAEVRGDQARAAWRLGLSDKDFSQLHSRLAAGLPLAWQGA